MTPSVAGGAALHRHNRQSLNPNVRIIAASGLGTAQRAGEGALEDVSVFLTKPYTAEKLLKTLAQVLS